MSPRVAVAWVSLPVWGLALLVGGASAAVFQATFDEGWYSDLPVHVLTVQAVLNTHTVPGDPLFFAAVALASGFQTDLGTLEVATVCVLALAVAAKFLISAEIALEETGARGLPLRVSGEMGLVVLVALLPFAFSLPTDTIFLGQEPPNVFHNSTTIFLMPFALLLFACSAAYLRTGERSWLLGTAVMALLNVLAKPSFVLVMIVVFPIAAFIRFRGSRAFLDALGLTAWMGLLIVAQYLYIYATGSSDRLDEATGLGGGVASGIKIDPFNVWTHFSTNVAASFLASFAFPLVALLAYRRRLWEYDLVRYGWALLGAALAIFILLSETGRREFHGNFGWQVVVCSYIVFLVTLIRIWELRDEGPLALRAIVWAAFAAHVVAGGLFLNHYFTQGTYL